MNIQSWDDRFLKLADFISTWSKDPSTKVGAVIIDSQRRIMSVGYNGFPKGAKDDDRLNNRKQKYKIIVHAECNAIVSAKHPLDNCTIYTYPFMPCSSCCSMIAQSGINRVVSFKNYNLRWEMDFKVSRDLLSECGVELVEY